MLLRIAQQIGSARAMRLWQGLLVTSNLSIDGAFVDFGAFRALPDWRKCRGANGECFGDEEKFFGKIVDSLLFYFKKYAPEGYDAPKAVQLLFDMQRRTHSAFLDSAEAGLGVSAETSPQTATKLRQLLYDYYACQQREGSTIEKAGRPQPWLYNAFRLPSSDHAEPDTPIAHEIRSLFDKSSQPEEGALSAITARRWLKPRPYLYYSVAHKHASDYIDHILTEDMSARPDISKYISGQVLKSRRFWPNTPPQFDIYLQTSNLYSSVLLGFDRRSKQYRAWIEGAVVDDKILIGEDRVPLCDVDHSLVSGDTAAFSVKACFDDLEAACVEVAGRTVSLSNNASMRFA